MPTMKVNLKSGQSYIGKKGLGRVQKDLNNLVHLIIKEEITIPSEVLLTHETITFRVTGDELTQLKEIAERKNLSIQKLLRLSMEQLNLITQ